jgi:hypothetical protein
MKSNVSPLDGVIRLIIAILLIMYAIMAGPWWIFIFSIPLIVTAAYSWCAIYEMFGVNTNWKELPKAH